MLAAPTSPAVADDCIRIGGVSQFFENQNGDEVHALQQIDLTVPRGEFVSLVGPSGCGKTTLLNIIAGEQVADSGTVTVEGSAPLSGRSDVAYMFARDALLPWRTAQQNVEYGLRIHGHRKKDSSRIARTWLEKVQLTGFESSYPSQLSHGMRQRTALARTFALDTPLLLMDEPFGALDAQTKMSLESILIDLWEGSTPRKTVVFITHDLAEAIALSDRVIVMGRRPGKLVADMAIDLDRPRSVQDLQSDPDFHRYYTELWETLRHGNETD